VYEFAGVLAALFALTIGGILICKRVGAIAPLAWIAFGAVAFGQVGLGIRPSGLEPWAMMKFLAVNIVIGAALAEAVRAHYRRLERM